MSKTIRLAFLLAVLAATSSASVVAVTSPGSLLANDNLDWGQLGPDLTVVTSPVNVTSLLGNTVNVANGTNELWSVQQSNSWGGNFNPGDNVLFNFAGGPLTLVFLTPVKAVGAHFQSWDFGAFGISITAFDSANTLLGTVTTSGTSNNAADGSAAFLGVLSSSADIASLVVNVQVSSADNPFALGSLSIAEQVAVPEPSTMFLAIGGVLAAVARRFQTSRRS